MLCPWSRSALSNERESDGRKLPAHVTSRSWTDEASPLRFGSNWPEERRGALYYYSFFSIIIGCE